MNYKVVNKYKLGKKQCTGSIIELDQGYCVQIYEANRELKNQVIQGAVVEDTPDESEIVKASIKLFDKKLKETDTVDITRLAKERKDEDFSKPILFLLLLSVKLLFVSFLSLHFFLSRTLPVQYKCRSYKQLFSSLIPTSTYLFTY